MLSLSVTFILSFLWSYPVVIYVFFFVFFFFFFFFYFVFQSRISFLLFSLSITHYRRQFLCKMWPIHLAFLPFIVFTIFLSSLSSYNASFLTRTTQMIFANFLQHHTRKLPTYFWYLLRSVHISAPHKLCPKCNNLLVSSLNASQFAGEKIFFFLNVAHNLATLDLI